ncbi:zinc ribbon domain-containing protein [Candidatus Pacearchaeota archaeon]|nr:zinc ribbon domain-containing protein [Candidatus Pacearchaeota archaeon]
MFKRKKCKNCGKRINDKFSFCPACGSSIRSSKDYGMLGRGDLEDPFEVFDKNMFGGISGKMLSKMLSGAMNMLEKEIQRNVKETNNIQKTNFELYINGKRINPQEIKVTKKLVPQEENKKIENFKFDKKTQKKFPNLPKEEPKTSIRRFSDKIVYEIEMPGVKSIKDVAIFQLENSIEIKALAKNKIFYKIIKVSLPIKKYNFTQEKLLLELDAKD